MLAVNSAPFCTERSVRFTGLAVVGADNGDCAFSEIREIHIHRLQEEVAGIKVQRLKAQGAETMRPKQRLIERKGMTGRIGHSRKSVIAAVEVVQVF